MASTTPARPRQSASRIGIPTPSKSTASSSGIPTPGRPRASSRASSLTTRAPALDSDSDQMARAFQDVIRKREQRRDSEISLSPNPPRTPASRSSGAAFTRPGSVASTSSAISSIPPRTPAGSRPKTPISSARLSFQRPPSRQAEARSSSRLGSAKTFEPGDPVRIESLGFEGILKYLGEIAGKPGTWAGVQLGPGFAGLGKNDGSVNSTQYFSCAPKCGVFVALNKLSRPPQRRPPSVASYADGRTTPAGSESGRITPAFSTPSARPRYSHKTPTAPPKVNQFSAGSRASKYASMTADRLRNATNTFTNTPPARSSVSSPTRSSPTRSSSRQPSPTRSPGRGSPTRTPKPLFKATKPSDLSSPARIEFATPKAGSRVHPMSPMTNGLLKDVTPITSPNLTTSPATSPVAESVPASIVPKAADAESDLLQSQISRLENTNARLLSELSEQRTKLDAKAKLLEEATARGDALASTEETLNEAQNTLSLRDSELTNLKATLEETRQSLTETQRSATTAEATFTEKLKERQRESVLIETRLDDVCRQFEAEKSTLNGQIDELRSAGQETIALYEDRISANEAQRYELEDRIASLQDKINSMARPVSPSTMARHASEAAQIDNETLREQAAHLQKRIAMLEEDIHDARASAEREEDLSRERTESHQDTETALRKEIESWKFRIEDAKRNESQAKSRVVELEDALKDNESALQNAQADVEGLRAELAIWETAQGPEHETLKSGPVAADEAATAEQQAEMTKLQTLLEAAQDEAGGLRKDCEGLRLGTQAEEAAKARLVREHAEATEKAQLLNQLLEELQASLNEQQAEIETLRKSRSLASAASSASSDKEGRNQKHELAEKREEINGLKHIVQQLSQENAALQSQSKIMEAERSLLISETEQLREELKILEENVEQSILREESLLDVQPTSALGDESHNSVDFPSTISHGGTHAPAPSEDASELRRKVSELEQKHARVVHDLNKEISELETLVESKIYREDELERELERYREKAARSSKKLSKGTDGFPPTVASNGRPPSPAQRPASDRCEICEQPGHDIFTCPILKEEKTNIQSHNVSTPVQWCEDCESHGHLAADCPHSMDVF